MLAFQRMLSYTHVHNGTNWTQRGRRKIRWEERRHDGAGIVEGGPGKAGSGRLAWVDMILLPVFIYEITKEYAFKELKRRE